MRAMGQFTHPYAGIANSVRFINSSPIVNQTLSYLGGDTQGTAVWEENLAICENRDMSKSDQIKQSIR